MNAPLWERVEAMQRRWRREPLPPDALYRCCRTCGQPLRVDAPGVECGGESCLSDGRYVSPATVTGRRIAPGSRRRGESGERATNGSGWAYGHTCFQCGADFTSEWPTASFCEVCE